MGSERVACIIRILSAVWFPFFSFFSLFPDFFLLRSLSVSPGPLLPQKERVRVALTIFLVAVASQNGSPRKWLPNRWRFSPMWPSSWRREPSSSLFLERIGSSRDLLQLYRGLTRQTGHFAEQPGWSTKQPTQRIYRNSYYVQGLTRRTGHFG